MDPQETLSSGSSNDVQLLVVKAFAASESSEVQLKHDPVASFAERLLMISAASSGGMVTWAQFVEAFQLEIENNLKVVQERMTKLHGGGVYLLKP
jgi:hypothetical protein